MATDEILIPIKVDTKEAEKKLDDFDKTFKRGPGRPRKIPIGVDDSEAKEKINGLKSAVKGFSLDSVLGGLAGGAAFGLVTSGFNALAGAIGGAFDSYKEFDSAVQNIATLGVVDDLDGLKQVLNDNSKTTVDDGSVLAGATYQALSAGVKGSNEELGAFVATASKVATAGGSDAETAVDALTTVMNAFKIETKDADVVSDQFFATIKAGKTDFGSLSSSLSNVAGAAASAGLSFGEISAGIATLTTQGIPTAQATTKIRSAIVALQKPNADTAKLFKQMGLTVSDVSGILKKPVEEGGGLTNFLNQLGEESAKSGKSFTQLFSSVEASSAALALTGDNAELAFSNLNAVLNDSAGSAEFAYKEASKSIENQLGLIKGSIQAFFNDAFTALQPFISGLLGGLSQAFDFVADLIGGVVSIVIDTFKPLFNLIKDNFNLVADLFGKFGDGGDILGTLGTVIKTLIQVGLLPLRATIIVVSKILGFLNNLIFSAVGYVVDFVKSNELLQAVFDKVAQAGGFVFSAIKKVLGSLGLWSEEEEKIEEKVVKKTEAIKQSNEVIDDNTDVVNDNNLAQKESVKSTSDYITQLAKLKIAGKDNTKEYEKLFNKTKQLASEEKLLADTVKLVTDSFGLATESSEKYEKSLENIQSESDKVKLALSQIGGGAVTGSLTGQIDALDEKLKGLKEQKPIELSSFFDFDNEAINELLNNIGGLDLNALNVSDEIDGIKSRSNDIINILKEQFETRSKLINNQINTELELNEKKNELEKKQRQKAFEKELIDAKVNEEQANQLRSEFNQLELDRDKLFISEQEKVRQSGKDKLKEIEIKYNEESAVIQEDALNKQKEIEAQRVALFNQVASLTETAFIELGAALTEGGKDMTKILVNTALDALDALVPILVAQITGISLASPESVATAGTLGLIKAGILTGLLKSIVGVARASIGGLQEGGLVGTGNKPKGNLDTELRWLDPQEFVLNRKAVQNIGVNNLQRMNAGTYNPTITINNKELIAEIQRAKLVQTNIDLKIKDATGGKFRIERNYR